MALLGHRSPAPQPRLEWKTLQPRRAWLGTTVETGVEEEPGAGSGQKSSSPPVSDPPGLYPIVRRISD